MKKIESFCVDHNKLDKGLYVSRTDILGNYTITTYDLRMIKPNTQDILSTGCIHTIEHLGATYLRNSSVSDDVIYFGPMGCRTGFYLILKGTLSPMDIKDILIDTFDYISSFNGDIPGATQKDCGNYLDMDLHKANNAAKNYLNVLKNLTKNNTQYSL